MDSLTNNVNASWKHTSTKVFWGEIAACDHVVQIYENDETFLELLTGFVESGLSAGECVIIIATQGHITSLNDRLMRHFDVDKLEEQGQYITLDAAETLSKFMVNDWPDENLFFDVVSELMSKAKADKRQVRAFGEMVALLWAQGQVGATVRLEQLWNKFCKSEAFCLFCAYPKSGFTQDAADSIMHICGEHAKMIDANGDSNNNVTYQSSGATAVMSNRK